MTMISDASISGGPALPESLRATLGGRYYTDERIFAAEQSAIFANTWCCAVRGDDIDTPGKFRTVEVGGESVLLARGRNGAVNAFLNVCRHRGARLCTDDSGAVRRSFQCPYHAWTYGLDGKLIAAPNLTGMPDVDKSEYGLHKVAVTEWLGYVWICLAAEPPSFVDTVVADVVDRLGSVDILESYDIANLQLGKRIRYEVKANWKQIIENFMECYHCSTIHPELTEVLPEFADGFAAQYYVGHGAEFGEEVQGFTVDGSEGVERLPGVGEDQDRKYYAITVKPGVFINLVPDHVIVHRMFAEGPELTVVECDWLYTGEVVSSGVDLSKSVELFHRVNQQDFDACERCQLSMHSRAYANGGVFVPSEHHIAAFHDWVTEQLSTTELAGTGEAR